MNKALIIIVFLFSFASSHASEEDLKLTTDRSIYISGESILYNCVLTSEMQREQLLWSNSIYIQLVNHQGVQWSKSVVKTDCKGANGQLLIPAETPSGYYLLHAETAWMRNMPVQPTSMKTIKVINPSQNINYKLEKTDKDQCRRSPGEIGIGFNRSNVKARDSLQMTIAGIKGMLNEQTFDYSVSVSINGSNRQFSLPTLQYADKTEALFFPETKGIILTGRVLNNKKPFNLVHVSLFRDELGTYSAHTDSAGLFRMGLPFGFGPVEAFVYCEDTTLKTYLTPQYRSINPGLPALLELSDYEKEIVKQFSFQAQIHNRISKSSTAIQDSKRKFYGRPNYAIRFSDYIRLPSIQEYFSELFPTVSIRARKHKLAVLFTNEPYSNPVYEPLLLLDMLKIDDAETILSLNPDDISHMEVVDQNYSLGGQTYSGILSVFSKNNDFAKSNIPENGFFFNIDLYTPSESWQNITIDQLKQQHLPLNKNCLYWQTNLSAKDLRNLKIYTGDRKGEFEIIITGVGIDGRVIEGRSGFTIE